MKLSQKFLKPVLLIIAIILLIAVDKLFTLHQVSSSLKTIHTTIASPMITPSPSISPNLINQVTFACDDKQTITALFYDKRVELTLSDGRHFALPQVISGSGARYANDDESIVFWNKGNTAFITEGEKTTYQNCVTQGK